MAFFDWNMDGKKDWQDSFLEFQIFTECMREDDKSDEGFDDFDDDDELDEYDELLDDIDED